MKWSIKYEEPYDPKRKKKFRWELERFIKNNSEGIKRKSKNVLEIDDMQLCSSVVKLIIRLGGEPFFRKEDLVSLGGDFE